MTDRRLRSLLVGSLGVAALQAAARALGLVTTLVLAALVGARGYGTYAWAIACVAVLRIPAAAGRDRLLVREIARGERHTVLRDSARAIALASLVLTCAGLVIASLLDERLGSALAVALPLLPLGAALGAAQGALQGLERVVAALAPDALLRPLLFLALVSIFAAPASAETVLLLQAVSTLAALLATLWLVRHHLSLTDHGTPQRSWNRSGLTIAANSGLAVVCQRIDVILVGLMLGATDAGVYALASTAASLAWLPAAAVTTPLSPAVARLHSGGEHRRLARAIAGATRWTFCVTAVGAATLALSARFGLGLVGEAFERGAGPLALLCGAAVISAAFTANNVTLVMTGEERAATLATALGAAVTAAGAAALIPVWSLNGAAVGVLGGTLTRNLLASRFTRTRLGLDTTLWSRRVEMAS